MQLFANNAYTTLASGISNTDTTMTVVSASTFPVISRVGDYFYTTLANDASHLWEVVIVTATSGTTFTIVRAQDNTTALTWSSGIAVEMRPVAQGLRDIYNMNSYLNCGHARLEVNPTVINCGGAA